jgi:N-acetylglucosamine-6-sulfatase
MRQQSPIDVAAELRIDQVHQLRVEALQSVDQHIDRFVRLLEEQNVLDNTIIIYTSDNGFQLGQHRLAGDKRHLYEHDVRVPFVIRGPDIPRNATLDQIVLTIDIAPTMFHVMNNGNSFHETVPLPDTMDGISFLPIANNTTQMGTYEERQDFLISYHGEGFEPCGLIDCPPPPHDAFHTIDGFNNTFHCVRSLISSSPLTQTDYTYCEFDDDEDFAEYYDNLVDPWQLHNMIHNISKEERSRLQKRLSTLRICRGQSCRPVFNHHALDPSGAGLWQLK